MQKSTTIKLSVLFAALSSATFANAALDMTGITGAIDATSIVAAITAVAAIKILPNVARWGYNKVISWIK